MRIYFPHETIRPVQNLLVSDINNALAKRKAILVHAPTGLGKTAAAMGPALTLALRRDLTVFFLTSRQTQHKIAIDTLHKIKRKYNLDFTAASIVGKKEMCCQPGIAAMRSDNFADYCKLLREEKSCSYYTNFSENKFAKELLVSELKEQSPITTEQVVEQSERQALCPYEATLALAAEAKVIISDYNYLFNPAIREIFFGKTGKKIESSIVIIDEAHNLAARIRELMTSRLTTRMLRRARNEAKELGLEDLVDTITGLQSALETFALDVLDGNDEALAEKQEFISIVEAHKNYHELIAELKLGSDIVLEQKKSSSLGTIAEFLEAWLADREGFCRIVSRDDKNIFLTHKCLDPSLLTADIIQSAYATIAMSGTLSPTEMYRDILGFPEDTVLKEYPSPFPEENRKVLIVPKTTTKYEKRGDTQYNAIADACTRIMNKIPGCCALFFPSYQLKDEIRSRINANCKKTLIDEQPAMTKQERQELLEKLKQYRTKDREAALFGVSTGSFGEGIDLPGVFNGVIIVGLPLEKPNLETQELIRYYDEKFGKGWEYGYVLPALTKCVQNAGRCIRSEKDRGALVFLDERYGWSMYKKAFPSDWRPVTTLNYEKEIESFFANAKV